MEPESKPQDYDQPVAYDINGQPLYAHPAAATPPPTSTVTAPSNTTSRPESIVASQAVHMAQPNDDDQFISDATRIKHDHSKQEYPALDLGEGEYVIACIRRHPIGLLAPFGIGILLITVAFSVLFNFDIIAKGVGLTGNAANPANIVLIILLFVVLVVLGTYAAYYVYTNSRFYLTNENVIEVSQMGMFTRKEQSVSLGSVEDVSYTQRGFLQETIGYGSIRVGTIGDTRSYKFNYVFEPKQYVETLNGALEAFRTNRPVTGA